MSQLDNSRVLQKGAAVCLHSMMQITGKACAASAETGAKYSEDLLAAFGIGSKQATRRFESFRVGRTLSKRLLKR